MEFVIRRADSWIRVYGFYDDEEDVYTDYTYYNGLSLEKEIRTSGVDGAKVKVMRMSGQEPIDVVQEDIGSDGISIVYAGRFIGSDPTTVTESDFIPKADGEECKDVGKYVFAISVIASANYNAVPEQYYYLEIVKADLTISFVRLTETGDIATDRGYASKIYDRTETYPTFNVMYDGFLGDDAEVFEYTNVFRVKHINEYAVRSTPDIEGLDLYNPYYEVFSRAGAILPVDVGTYSVRLVFGEDYGLCKNYNILPSYVVSDGATLYPVLEIMRRPVDLIPGEIVIKTYDSNTRIPEGVITPQNYVFIPCYDDRGNVIPLSGPVEGDVVDIRFDYTFSRFERKDVFDENDEQSPIPVRIYGFDITNNNYRLELSQLFSDEDGEYFLLVGQINPATAEIHFADEFGNGITTRSEVTYNAEPHAITVIINGVKTDSGEYEDVEYTVRYDCDDIIYHLFTPPVNAQTYKVSVEVVSKNYVNNHYTLELVINKAHVQIVFGGDVVQTYGSVLGGLTAVAYGVGNYESPLIVRYYDENQEEVNSIITANAAKYIARAIHEESANFLYEEAEEDFTILRRGIYPEMNVYSSYAYSGKEVEIDVSFDFNGVTYYPRLRFSTVGADGSRTPYNFGDSPVSSAYPVDAGSYSVSPADDLQNFAMMTDAWINFRITPVPIRVSIADMTLTVVQSDAGAYYVERSNGETGLESASINVSFNVDGAVAGERLNKIFVTQPSVRYSDSFGNVLSKEPTEAGIYVMTPYGGVSKNYIVTYNYGVLQLNKPVVSRSMSGDEEEPDIIIEGSFGVGVSLVARVANETQYNRVMTAYETFRLTNEEFKDYNVYTVYDLRLSDGNVTLSGGGRMTVRLLLKDFFKSRLVAEAADEDEQEEKYYVARLSADGTITMLDAEQEGEYLVFSTESLETFAILSSTISSGSSGGYDWILYVGIAFGVIMIGIAILIVRLKA